MARVETVVQSQAYHLPTAEQALVFLRPNEITIDPAMLNARPGPVPANEDRAITRLSQSIRQIGQIVPIAVERYHSGEYGLIDGRRRLKAAVLLDDDDHPFKLACVVIAPGDSARRAIHANLKRRGLTPLQFAHLCAELRKENKWEGTKEVAEYLDVSRAMVSQHDKLLSKPKDMPLAIYRDLIAKVGSGKIGAETAFYALTHVEPTKLETVLPRAQAIASREAVQTSSDRPTTRPGASKSQGKGKESSKATVKLSPAAQKAQIAANKEQRAKHKARVEAAKNAKIEKKHLQAAAREQKAMKTDLQRGLPDLRRMFDVLRATSYPDVMRNFISILADQWWRGDAQDREVVTHWNQIAMLVEKQEELDAKKHHETVAKRATAKRKK